MILSQEQESVSLKLDGCHLYSQQRNEKRHRPKLMPSQWKHWRSNFYFRYSNLRNQKILKFLVNSLKFLSRIVRLWSFAKIYCWKILNIKQLLKLFKKFGVFEKFCIKLLSEYWCFTKVYVRKILNFSKSFALRGVIMKMLVNNCIDLICVNIIYPRPFLTVSTEPFLTVKTMLSILIFQF